MAQKKPIKHPPQEQSQRTGREHEMTPKPMLRPREAPAGKLDDKVALTTFDKKKVAEFGTDVPHKRAGEPTEVAPCYLFLASSNSSYMTGQVLHPNGGEVVNG